MNKTRAYITNLSILTILSAAAVTAGAQSNSIQLLEYQEPSATVERAGSPAPLGFRGQSLRGANGGSFEVEPNGTSATATPIVGSNVFVSGTVFPVNDVDFYSFTAAANERVYVAVQTLFDASASGDSVLDVLDVDGTTVLENDPNDGTFNANSSSIAGRVLPAAGTYFIRVRHNLATGTIRPYGLNFRLQSSAAPTAEVEPNNTSAQATPLPVDGHVSGTATAVSPGESDFYSINLNAGDTVFLSLDMNPERDASVWNGRLGFGLFGNPPANQIILANDANAGASAADPNSEAFFFTVKDAGTYFVYVDSIVAAGLGATATYNLSVSVRPQQQPAGSMCTTYTSTDVPQTIPTGPGQVSSTITVPGNPRIADIDVAINLNHTFMQDIDAHLVSPAGNDNGLFTDIGGATVGGAQTLMDVVFDDEAALPPAFALTAPFRVQPELAYRLGWFDGENAGGTWTLTLRDDATGDGGTLNGWSITVCEPVPPPTCPVGFVPQTVYSTDFETDDAGFTHSGTQDEWQRGLPSFAPITTCNSGTNCFKTDLVNTYNTSSNQNLLSPNINLAGLSGPVVVRWNQRHHIESANFDHYNVNFRPVGAPASNVNLFEWLDGTMNNTVGNPAVTINESSGWSEYVATGAALDALAGQNTELEFHLDSDTTVQLTGVAIDDVSVTACRAASADLSITKTDGVASAVPGQSVTYTITASNAGPDAATGSTIADTFPATLTCSTTCVGAGGGTCTAGPVAGNLNDTADLPTGGSVTYTSVCQVAAGATGSLSNTATVSNAITDPTPGNNSATDTDTLTPQADLSITNSDFAIGFNAGGTTTYTITASNAGPSNDPAAQVTDTFPANLTCTWTCVGAGGGTCTASGSGNISDTVNLPAGGSVIYSAVCTADPNVLGMFTTTATVATSAGVTELDPSNNTAADTNEATMATDPDITKTDSQTSVSPGATLTYVIVASNLIGPSRATLAVTDTPPAECQSFTWTCAVTPSGSCGAASGSGAINDLADVFFGSVATYTATCVLNPSISNVTVSNTAAVSVSNGITIGPDNEATDTTDISGNPDVSGSKTVAGSFFPGGNIVYTIVLTNSGTSTQGDNAGSEFVDVLPAQVTGGVPTATTGTVVNTAGTISWDGSIPAGGSVTITIPATINLGASGTVTNQGTINTDLDGNGSNETARSTDDPAVVGAADPTGFPIATTVPTLDRLGLIILVLGVLGLMWVRARSAP